MDEANYIYSLKCELSSFDKKTKERLLETLIPWINKTFTSRFFDLPKDICSEICTYLNFLDVKNLRCVCKTFVKIPLDVIKQKYILFKQRKKINSKCIWQLKTGFRKHQRCDKPSVHCAGYCLTHMKYYIKNWEPKILNKAQNFLEECCNNFLSVLHNNFNYDIYMGIYYHNFIMGKLKDKEFQTVCRLEEYYLHKNPKLNKYFTY